MEEESDIGAISDFPAGKVVRVSIEGRDCAVAQNEAGALSVFEDNCPHLDLPIADGRVEGSFLVCPWHGAYFDLETGASQSPLATRPLRKFQSRIAEGRLLCRLKDWN